VPKARRVFILSDATGDTASRVVRAALKQFVGGDVEIRRFPNVLHVTEVRSIVKEAQKAPTLVAHTFAASPLRKIVEECCSTAEVQTLDLLGPLLTTMGEFLHAKAQEKPGLLHQIDEQYFRRIDAVEFAVMHDDGKHVEGLRHADFVLLGLSRTGKTPLSVYLALEGWRVGNIPLVPGQQLPKEALELPRNKVVGLVLDPRRLTDVRRSRLEYLAPGHTMAYDDEESIREEVAWSRRLFTKHGIRFIDVTERAIEESAHQVLSIVKPTKDERNAAANAKDRIRKKA
jgi:regulator of PEP synthase PpsR (kinase-PPPase family)